MKSMKTHNSQSFLLDFQGFGLLRRTRSLATNCLLE
jgi:hypothetical protein